MNKLLYVLILVVSMSCQRQQDINKQDQISLFKTQKSLIQPEYYDTVKSILAKDGIISNDSTAVKVVEQILFNIYGEDNIVKQRPYSVVLKHDSIWSIQGKLPNGWDGGVFYIELNKNTGKVEKIFHDK
ncbi:MAG: YbbC/YhhH family protein [Myroides sp.]|nr:YbbC/YhhH family protein [Myroides sp.]